MNGNWILRWCEGGEKGGREYKEREPWKALSASQRDIHPDIWECRDCGESTVVLFVPTAGFPLSTLSVLFVTYCGVQLVKERERRLALLEEQEAAEKAKTE